ncbi:MAG: hypothetical protein KC594_18650, partial [Nitrospira sp.]|nr:hypothetical protein [Nitrospira sp.]
GGMGGMGGMGGGMFRVEADKTIRFKVPTVCLEHGKHDPNPRMKYRIVPIEQVNKDPRVSKLCELIGYGEIPQNTAQAAAWHMANGLSWQELSLKNRIESQFVGNIRFFNRDELMYAQKVSNVIAFEYEKYLRESSSSSSSSENTVDSSGDAN